MQQDKKWYTYLDMHMSHSFFVSCTDSQCASECNSRGCSSPVIWGTVYLLWFFPWPVRTNTVTSSYNYLLAHPSPPWSNSWNPVKYAFSVIVSADLEWCLLRSREFPSHPQDSWDPWRSYCSPRFGGTVDGIPLVQGVWCMLHILWYKLSRLKKKSGSHLSEIISVFFVLDILLN